MITNFYTLRALVEEWRGRIPGLRLADAFSQEKGELTLAFAAASEEMMLRLSVEAPMPFMFRVDGYSKARRNVATLFESAFDRQVEALRIAHRDRMIYIDLSGGWMLQIMLFGPRANVFLVGTDEKITEAFQNSDELAGEPAPEARSAPTVDDFETFVARWRTNRKTLEQALSSTFPLFDRAVAREALLAAQLDPGAPPELDEKEQRRLYDCALRVETQLNDPVPRIYWAGRDPVQFSLVPLSFFPDAREDVYDTTDEAAATYVKSTLAQLHYERLYRPVEKALADAADHYRTSADRMMEELARESRAERYEHFGHLLMAHPNGVPIGAEEVELEDWFADGEPVCIDLDPAKSAVENAQDYYRRARRTRRSREEAERRLEETDARARRAEALLADLRRIEGLKGIREFRKDRASELAPFLPDDQVDDDRVPFRRYALSSGYEVWVGRNARQNDELTFRHAQKYDLWMHARGVPGSHAVLRLPNRDATPDRIIVQQAASIAAYYSKARGSGLVPVIVTERKYVRKPKGADPGAVLVDREDVVIVEPVLPT